MKQLAPPCPGSVTRWCSTPALWILLSQQHLSPAALCAHWSSKERGASWGWCRKTAAASWLNFWIRNNTHQTKCAEVPVVCVEVSSNVCVCVYVYTCTCIHTHKMYTDKAVVGLPSSVCTVLCCSPVFLLCCYHQDFTDFIWPLTPPPRYFCFNSALFLTWLTIVKSPL